MEQTTIGWHEERLTRIQDLYQRVDELDKERKALQRQWDERLAEERAELKRLIESPVPSLSDERKGLLQNIQQQHQDIDQTLVGKKTEMHEIRATLKEAKARLRALIEDDGQLDITEGMEPPGEDGDNSEGDDE